MTVAELIAHLQTISGFEDAMVIVSDGHCCTGDDPDQAPAVFYDPSLHHAFIIADMDAWDFALPEGTRRIGDNRGEKPSPQQLPSLLPPFTRPQIQSSMSRGPEYQPEES